jgi:hypothetical protein
MKHLGLIQIHLSNGRHCQLWRVHLSRILDTKLYRIPGDDIYECGQQVKCMAAIYRCARRVVVWLGPDEADGAQALLTLDHLGRRLECTLKNYVLPSVNCTEPDWFRRRADLPYSWVEWESTLKSFQRPWFTRL